MEKGKGLGVGVLSGTLGCQQPHSSLHHPFKAVPSPIHHPHGALHLLRDALVFYDSLHVLTISPWLPPGLLGPPLGPLAFTHLLLILFFSTCSLWRWFHSSRSFLAFSRHSCSVTFEAASVSPTGEWCNKFSVENSHRRRRHPGCSTPGQHPQDPPLATRACLDCLVKIPRLPPSTSSHPC